MKVMYFAFEGFDTKNGTNHLAIKMLDEFLENNIEVYLMSSHTTGVYDDIPDRLKDRQNFSYDIVNRNVVSKTNFIQRYFDGFTYAFRAMKKWKKEIKDVDVVILQSTPTAIFSTLLLHFLGKKPIIYNNFDVFPDGSYAMGAIKSKLIYKVLHKVQGVIYKISNKIVVISQDMKETFIENGVPEEKLIEIKNWYDDSSIRNISIEENKFIKKYDIDTNKFYVQYAGNFGYTFDYKMVLDIAEIVKNHEHIVFQMIGDGAFREDFVSEAKQRKLNNIEFYPWQPLDIISDVYSACSIQLIPLSNGVIRNSFPSKSSILMACERVVLTTTEENSNYYKEVNASQVGICVSNHSPENAAKSIIELYSHPHQMNEMAKEAKKYAERLYSSSANVYKYIDLIKSVIKENVYVQG